MKTNNTFKKQCNQYKDEIKGQAIRVLGHPYIIFGVGQQTILLKGLAPKGLSTKAGDCRIYIKWGEVSKDLMDAVTEHFPEEQNFEEEKEDYVEMLLRLEQEQQEEETKA